MTRSQTKDKYTHFLSGIDSIESRYNTFCSVSEGFLFSQNIWYGLVYLCVIYVCDEYNKITIFSLHTNLVEHLNAEIVLHTISDVNMALDWIRSTFLYIRALKNPKHYGKS